MENNKEFIKQQMEEFNKRINLNVKNALVVLINDLVKVDKENLLEYINKLNLETKLLMDLFNHSLEIEEYRINDVIKLTLESRGERI